MYFTAVTVKVIRWDCVGCDNDSLRAGRSGDRIPIGKRFSLPVLTGPNNLVYIGICGWNTWQQDIEYSFNNMCWLNILVCHKCTRLIQACKWITTLLVLWLMLLYVYITFGHHSLVLWPRKCGIQIFFFLEHVWKNFTFCSVRYCCCCCCCCCCF